MTYLICHTPYIIALMSYPMSYPYVISIYVIPIGTNATPLVSYLVSHILYHTPHIIPHIGIYHDPYVIYHMSYLYVLPMPHPCVLYPHVISHVISPCVISHMS